MQQLPPGDETLVQIVNAAWADAAHRAGAHLSCRPGCTQCCQGAFAINALDVARLQAGIRGLRVLAPSIAEEIRQRGRSWIEEYGADFPGDPKTGILGTSLQEQVRFEEFANQVPCPALNPATGFCDLYEWRPMTCRVFGPPVRMAEGDSLGCCELCFADASEEKIVACEMSVPHELEEKLLEEMGGTAETVVAFAIAADL